MSVTLNFGDGTPQGTAELDDPVEHEYARAGSFGISASDSEGHRGTTHVTGPGKYQITVHAKDDGGESGPAEPTLTVPDLQIHVGDDDVDHETTLVNAKGESQHCTGKITVSGGAVLDGRLTMEMPGFFGPGGEPDPVVVVWTVQDADLVGTYPGGDGFPIVEGLDGATTNQWSVSAGAPFGSYPVVTEILDEDGERLTAAAWGISLKAATS